MRAMGTIERRTGLDRELELARRRQELRMRVAVLLVVIVMVLGSTAATIVHGASLVAMLPATASVALLAWIVRRLFPPT
jgi:hypothetical protein